LIISLPPDIFGGVRSSARLAAETLRDHGHHVTIAFPATRSHRPELNGRPFGRRPRCRNETVFDEFSGVAVGTYLPELEFTYSRPSSLWRAVIHQHEYHIVVSGTAVLAMPLVEAGVPYLLWCASDVVGDRAERQKAMGVLRQVLDRGVITPQLQRQERRVLNGRGGMATISPYSQRCLQDRMGSRHGVIGILPIPTDMRFFQPPEQAPHGRRIGFAGRLADPRKNASLLFDAMVHLNRCGPTYTLAVTGAATPQLEAEIAERGLQDAVVFVGMLSAHDLRQFYQDLDVFVIPSFQEGHAIVGVEAMACGVPVVSTRCGGPEAYVEDGKNGFLVDFDPNQLARRINDICENPDRRQQLSHHARASVVRAFGICRFQDALRIVWRKTFDRDL